MEVGEQLETTPWLFRVYLEMKSYPSYVGIFQKHCKDLYETTRIQWKGKSVIFCLAQVKLCFSPTPKNAKLSR